MSLADLIQQDVTRVLLNDNDMAERVVLSGGGSSRRETVVFTEQPEQQTIRRAHVFCGGNVVLNVGDVFSRQGRTWRLLYQDETHNGMSRWLCHEQLPTVATIQKRSFLNSVRGVGDFNWGDVETRRVKITQFDGEVDDNGRRRRMQSEFRIYFETEIRPTTDELVIGRDGNTYRIETYQAPDSNDVLPFAVAVTANG